MKENVTYGKRHIEFNQKQQITLNEATKVYENASHEIITILEKVSNDLKSSQKKLKEELANQQITEKLETRKDEFIGIEKKKRGKAKGRELKEEKMKLQEKLLDAYLISMRLRYLSTIIEMLERNFENICKLLCSQSKPKFELILMINETLFLEPDLEKQKRTILTCAKLLMAGISNNRCMAKLETFFNSALQARYNLTIPYSQFIEIALQSTGKFIKYEQIIEIEINRDIEACAKFISQYKHLESIKMVGVT